MHKVILENKTLFVEDGTLLSEVLIKENKDINHLCGGKGTCKKCLVLVNGKEELSCQYRICSDITVGLERLSEIYSETGAEETGKVTENLCFALDIGTTTLALALVSMDEKKIVRTKTATNPQRKFGADIMTRIDFCHKNGVTALHETLISEINSMVSSFNVKEINKMYVSGNATMLHIFFNIDPSSMGTAPYTPIFLEGKREDAESLGIKGVREVESLPSIDSFVGADIVAGLNLIGLPKKDKHSLLIDLGTNAEIVLFDENTALCTASAAGPCFEGANITYGMSATDGAIYSYKNGKAETIGQKTALGICGTGLVDIIAELVSSEIIDETGAMDDDFLVTEGVSLTQNDIRQYQLAKSAVYSGVMTLLKLKKISFEQIDKMYISGGFSAKINIENAVKTGLLPRELKEKCEAIKNSSLLGTVKFALEQNDLDVFKNKARYVDLSSNSTFSDFFVENMMF